MQNKLNSMGNFLPFKTVMLIDDDDIALFLTERRLLKESFCEKAMLSTEADEALNYLINKRKEYDALPDLIFLDINMPLMDGWSFLDKFKDIDFAYRPPVFMLTSSDAASDKIKSSRYPGVVNGFYNKPIKAEDVYSIIYFLDENGLRKAS
jgi:CheY-like chemotaxis protein